MAVARALPALLLAASALAAGCAPMAGAGPAVGGAGWTAYPPAAEVHATADLRDASGAPVGRAYLTRSANGVLIRLSGDGSGARLKPGWHGMHLHAVGRCDGPGFQSAAGHVNHGGGAPGRHGLLNPAGPEAGDLPNLFVNAAGAFQAEVFTALARLDAQAGPTNVPALLDADGSALLIHAVADDQRTQPIGGSGDRVACGVIGAGM
jgi:Cu-Zn family superoxide dismutase